MVSLSNKKVLITGASGFTGVHLVAALTSLKCEVIELVGRDKFHEKQISLDLLDKKALKKVIKSTKPDFIIHLAAISFVGHDNDLAFYNVNVLGTQNLLEAVVDCGLSPKILIASSAIVYGSLEKEMILRMI